MTMIDEFSEIEQADSSTTPPETTSAEPANLHFLRESHKSEARAETETPTPEAAPPAELQYLPESNTVIASKSELEIATPSALESLESNQAKFRISVT